MLKHLFLFFCLFAPTAHAAFKVHPVEDVCDVYKTMLHYTDSKCFTVNKAVSGSDPQTFHLKGLMVTKLGELEQAKNKPTIILVPGGPGESAQMFRYALDKKDMILGMVGYWNVNVVLFDPRGTGASLLPKPATAYGHEALSTQLMVEDLRDVVQNISTGQPIYLMAHSAGGSIAAQFGIQYPELVSKIVMISTMMSPRQMAQVNLQLYAKVDYAWQRFMDDPLHQALPLKELNEKYTWIEDVAIQQLKAALLKKYEVEKYPRIYPQALRDQVTVLGAGDTSGQAVADLVNQIYDQLKILDATTPLVPEALRTLKLTKEILPDLKFTDPEWIKVQIMCGEGILPEELGTETFMDGITMSRFCGGLHAKDATELVDVDLSQLKTPVLYMMGDKDTQVPVSIARQLIMPIPNLQIVEEVNAGHILFYEAPVVFYKNVENFLKH